MAAPQTVIVYSAPKPHKVNRALKSALKQRQLCAAAAPGVPVFFHDRFARIASENSGEVTQPDKNASRDDPRKQRIPLTTGTEDLLNSDYGHHDLLILASSRPRKTSTLHSY